MLKLNRNYRVSADTLILAIVELIFVKHPNKFLDKKLYFLILDLNNLKICFVPLRF